ncbi:ABC transporter permease [Leifsonia sp. NPDC058248]|uniref:ABC transporter permease n=1 Tax=Leifsonia sp. NPDC058248 TaxID=3346402 RepID=UPI0036D9CF1E
MSAITRVIPTILAMTIVAGATTTVLMTTGRTEGAHQRILATVDQAGTRAVSLTAPPSAGLDSSIVERLAGIDGIAWVGAFGVAQDGRNNLLRGGEAVATRSFWSTKNGYIHLPEGRAEGGWASGKAVSRLGMVDGMGTVQLDSGVSIDVVGTFELPAFLDGLEPSLLVPQSPTQYEPVTLVVAIADSPNRVQSVGHMLISVADPADAEKLKLQTSAELAKLRSAIDGGLGDYGREIMIGSFAVTAILIAAVLLSLVTMRRKDFGRRRALGATRGYVVGLITTQGATTGVVGALFGGLTSAIALYGTGSPLPSVGFMLSIMLLMSVIATISSIPPAVVASGRDPAAELRVP